MGSFPIQSCTACADEWLEHGVGGLLVPPEDPDVIAAALRQALTDDGLVDGGAEQNWRVACARLAADDLRDSARGVGDGHEGVLRIGMGSGPGAMLMTPLLLKMAQERPRLRVEVARAGTELLV